MSAKRDRSTQADCLLTAPKGPALGLPPADAGYASFGIPGIFMDQSGRPLSPAERRASIIVAEQAGTPMAATKTEGPR